MEIYFALVSLKLFDIRMISLYRNTDTLRFDNQSPGAAGGGPGRRGWAGGPGCRRGERTLHFL